MNKLEQKFLSNVQKTATCWVWTRPLRKGYGRFFVGLTPIPAHRMAYEIYVGAIPDGLIVCHKCDNKECVRPNHLFLGTNKDNSIDMMKKGRGKNQFKNGEKHPNHVLTLKQVVEIRKLLKTDNKKQSEIAAIFSVHPCVISRIKNNRRWANSA